MVDLASLVVKLSAETSQYNAAITKATEQIGGFADKVGDSIRDVAKDLLGLEALKQAFDFTENIVKTLARFDELAHAVGATTEALSQLSFAGKLSGIDDIAVPLEKLAHSVGEVATGNQNLIDTFAALGVSIRDSGGKIKATDQQLLDIADAVSKYNDGLAKTAAVQAIFGRSGADFIKFLDQGSAGIKAAQQEAIDLGVSVSSSSARAADEFESNMTRIGAAFQGIFFKALEEVLPTFQAITDQIVDFAKNADNVAPIVEQIVAGLKVIASALVIIGTAFEVVGKYIGAFVFEIGQEIGALGDLAKAFADPIAGMKAFVDDQKKGAEDLASLFLHPIDATKNFVAEQKKEFDDLANIFRHPIDSLVSFFKAKEDAVADSPAGDMLSALKAGALALNGIWGGLNDQLSKVHITAKKIKPDLVLVDRSQIQALESAIEALAKLDDTLKQQVATYGLSGAAATVYDVTLGKLSASVDELNKKSPGEAKTALADLEKQGKLSKASIDAINTAMAAGVPIGDAFKTAIIEDATALERLKGVDALSKLDSQLLAMTGHLEEASKAAFDLANRPLQITIRTAQDRSAFSGLDDTQKTAEATQQLNTLKQQAIAIEDALGKKVADVDAAAATSGENNLKLAGDEAAARQAAIAQLEALYVKAQALADATGLKSATDQALALRDAIGAIQFNPKILEDVDKATEAQKRFNEALKDEKNANDDLSLQLAGLAKQNAEGALTDLDYAAKQDEARQRAIDQLMAIQQQELEVIKNNPGNAQALDDYKKLGVQITELQTQMGQLAKTIRTDLTDSLSNAFVDFADGSKSASAALRAFVADFTKEMLQLGSKALFQKLFDTTGISSGINSLFGAASKALPAAASATGDLAGTTAAATSLSTAITTAATAGGTAMGTEVSTAATAGATELGAALGTAATAAATEMATAITTAGSAAAAEMAAAIAGSGAASGAGAAGAAAILAAAGGGPIPANQLTLVGEVGPELFVSDLGESSAATATKAGTVIPEDLTHAHVVGTGGPEFIRPNVSGFVVPSDTFLAALDDRTAPAVPPAIPAGPDVPLRAEFPRPLAPVIELIPRIPAPPTILRTTLPARTESLFAKPEATAAEMPEPPTSVNKLTPIRAPVESGGAPPIESAPPIPSNVIAFPAQPPALPSPPTPIETAVAGASNVIAFPLPKQPVSGAEFAATMLDVASALPPAPDRLDTEVTRASAPEKPAQFDEPNSEMVMKFEKIVKHEQADLLDAHEYEALLTDRYLQKRQSGGPVSAGTPYLVGEGGPELMVPDSSGTVMNSWETQNHRAVVNNVMNHFVINTPTGKVDRASQGQIAARTAASVQAASARNN